MHFVPAVDPTLADILAALTDLGIYWPITLAAVVSVAALVYRRFRR